MTPSNADCQEKPSYLNWLRSRVGTQTIPLTYSTAIVRDGEGRILFQRRTDFNIWGLPGGVLEPGETPAGCAIRETHEETGLLVKPERLIAVLSSPSHNVLYPNGDRAQQISPYFLCSIVGGKLQSANPETSDAAFFTPDLLPPTLPWYQLAIQKTLEDSSIAFFDAASVPVPEPSGQPIWRILREKTGPEPLVLPGATALIRNASGSLLFLRRTDSAEWTLPGGLLELGENLAETIIREVREETGLTVKPATLLGILGGHEVVFSGGDRLFPIGTWFECLEESGQLIPDGLETDRAEYFPANRLPPMPHHLKNRLLRVLAARQTPVFN